MLWIDTFGNIQTNIGPDDLAEVGISIGDDVLVSVSMQEFRITWGVSYSSVEDGEAVVHVDSHGQMALAVRGGRADEDFPLRVGDPIVIGRPDGGNRINLEIVPAATE